MEYLNISLLQIYYPVRQWKSLKIGEYLVKLYARVWCLVFLTHSVDVVCVSVGHKRKPYKNGGTDRDATWSVDSGGPQKPGIRWGPRSSPVKGQFGSFPLPLKCIRLCKQQRPQQHGAANFLAGTSRHGESEASEWTHPPQGVTSAGAMRPFVKILWPLVMTCLANWQQLHADKITAN